MPAKPEVIRQETCTLNIVNCGLGIVYVELQVKFLKVLNWSPLLLYPKAMHGIYTIKSVLPNLQLGKNKCGMNTKRSQDFLFGFFHKLCAYLSRSGTNSDVGRGFFAVAASAIDFL